MSTPLMTSTMLMRLASSTNYNLNKSMVFEDGRGGKCSKSRITVMPVANMSGFQKLKPLVINNCWKLHTFSQKRINIHELPMEFHANKKAWLTSNLCSAWLYKQGRIFTRQKRKVAFILHKLVYYGTTLPPKNK